MSDLAVSLLGRIACWLSGHRWYEKSYAATAEWRIRRTRECIRCGAYEEERHA